MRSCEQGTASAYCDRLLGLIGFERPRVKLAGDHSSRDWELSGAMQLTGRPDGQPLLPEGAPASAMRGALAALSHISGATLPGVELLGMRAPMLGLGRRGSTSAGGASRILATADGWWVLTLARSDDLDLIPALVSEEVASGSEWAAVTSWCRTLTSTAASSRAHLLGLPAAAVPPRPLEQDPFDWKPRTGASGASPNVVDLSSLWAGPLSSHLLALAGAQVTKVESSSRPDGARRGTQAFFDLLSSGSEKVSLDLSASAGRAQLRELIASADIVIESSRPRALLQLGIDASALAVGKTWVSITAYGRQDPSHRVGFGDDVAAGAGLVAYDPAEPQHPLFAGDAIADPLTGAHAALVAYAGWLQGGAGLIDLSMHRVSAAAAGLRASRDAAA